MESMFKEVIRFIFYVVISVWMASLEYSQQHPLIYLNPSPSFSTVRRSSANDFKAFEILSLCSLICFASCAAQILKLGSIARFLEKALDPPTEKGVSLAIKNLTDLVSHTPGVTVTTHWPPSLLLHVTVVLNTF